MKKILFVNQDTTPYVEENVLANLGMMIPNKLQEAGNELRIIMPLYGVINERRGQLHEVIRLSGLNININEIDHPVIIKVASIPQTKLQARLRLQMLMANPLLTMASVLCSLLVA